MSTWFRLLTCDRVLTDRMPWTLEWWCAVCVCVCLCMQMHVCMWSKHTVVCAYVSVWMCLHSRRQCVSMAVFVCLSECIVYLFEWMWYVATRSHLLRSFFSSIYLPIYPCIEPSEWTTITFQHHSNLYNNGTIRTRFLFLFCVFILNLYKQTVRVFWQTIEMAQQTKNNSNKYHATAKKSKMKNSKPKNWTNN